MIFNNKNQRVNIIQRLRPEEFELKEIDKGRGPYCMSFGFDLEKYTSSIESIGLINTPTIVRTDKGKMIPVTGYRRLTALRALKQKKVPCRELTDLGFSDFELFRLNLAENLATRRFNDVEKGMILNGLTAFLPRDHIIDHYMPLLGLHSRQSDFSFYTRMDNELNSRIKELLIHGRISLQAVRMLMSIDKSARPNVSELIANLKLNVNRQRQLIEYLVDLSYAKSQKIQDILNQEDIGGLISNKKLNKPQKAKALLAMLKSLRFPRLSSAEKDFSKRVAGLNLPKGVRIIPSPFFEGSSHTIQIPFKNGKELMKHIEKLKKINGLEGLTDPW